MFRDKQEELARIEEALLEDEELLADEAEEVFPEDVPESPYPNYGSRYKVYNADKSDTDLEEYSDEVYEGRSGVSGLVITALLLSVALLGVMVWILLRYWI